MNRNPCQFIVMKESEQSTPRKLEPHPSTVSISSLPRTPALPLDKTIWIPTSLTLSDLPKMKASYITYGEVRMSPAKLHRNPSSPFPSGIHSHAPCGVPVRVNETDIALFRLELKGGMGSKIFATQLTCPHMGGDLTEGAKILVTDVEDLVIECPLHHYRFDMRTGKLASAGTPPVGYATDKNQHVGPLQTYPVRINKETELIEIGFEALNPLMFSPDFD